jgi:hypothetical protein
MRKCWAACLGGCSDKISGEHIISDGVFLDGSVKVKGLPWCLDNFKTIGLASLVKNVLCTTHNSRLSDADVGAIQLRRAICDSASLSEARAKMQPHTWPVENFLVAGLAIERWCLKTLITIASGGKVPIGGGESQPGEASRALVETAFGLRRFESRPAGLHWIGDPGEVVNVADGVVVTTFSNRSNRLAGARFWFWGLNFLLMLSDWPAEPFGFTSSDGKKTIQPTTLYRPRALNISVGGRLSHAVEFAWRERDTQL